MPGRYREGKWACLIVAAALLPVAGIYAAPPVAGFDDPRTETLAAQPPGLTMELRLPKTRFFQGEIIPATLVFRNESHRPYSTWIGTYDRSGRIPDLGFHAVAENGEPVPDPLQRYFRSGGGMLGGGLGNDANLGQWEITLPINQWLRFDGPGVYRVYGWSERVKTGSKDDPGLAARPAHTAVKLVSQVVTVQIAPLTPAQEQEILTQAKTDLASDENKVRYAAVERLRYLQTPAARNLLLPLVGRPDMHGAYLALESAPDPVAEADRLFQAVATHRLPLNQNMIVYYPQLKAGGFFGYTTGGKIPPSPPDDAATALLDAAKASLLDHPWDAVSSTTLATLFQQDAFVRNNLHGPGDPQVRALMAEHQLDLPDPVADELLKRLDKDGGQELLPLARRAVQPPRNSASALKLLARLAPDEARRVIVDDVEHPPFKLRRGFGDPHFGRNFGHDLQDLLSLPDGMLLPELDETLRERLRHPVPEESETDEDIEASMMLADRYGSPTLLPDVLRVYLVAGGPHYANTVEAALRFWLRCDPTAGAEAVRVAFVRRNEEGDGNSTLLDDVLGKRWHAEALPVVLGALDDRSERMCVSAARVLVLHDDDPEAAEKVLATAERFGAQSLPEDPAKQKDTVDLQAWLVDILLKNGYWPLKRAQLVRLQTLPNLRQDIQKKIAQRLAITEE